MKITLSAFADEASDLLDTQLAVLQKANIPLIELRGVDGKNVSDLTEDEAQIVREKLAAAGIGISAIGSPLGKIEINGNIKAHLDKAAHTFRLANILGAEKIRMFSFFTKAPGCDFEKVHTALDRMLALAKEYGVILCHENEKEIYGDTPARCLALLTRHKELRCVFDPANFVQCGIDTKEALALLAGKIDYYHIKDAMRDDGAVVPAGMGDGNILSIIESVDHDTVLTLEPHLSLFSGYHQIDKSELLHKYAYNSPEEAFLAAVAALRDCLTKCGYKEENKTWTK